jgi:hypothetical protein
MASVQKTVDRAEKAAKQARNTAANGVQSTRSVAAEVLDTLGSSVRRQTDKAAHATEHTGARIADVIEDRADQVRGRQGGSLLGYFRRHPMQFFLLLGIMTGVVAVIAVPALRRSRAQEDEIDPITGRNLSEGT